MRNFSISFLLTGIILSVVYKNNHEISAGSRFAKQLYELSADTIKIDSGLFFLETFLYRNAGADAGKENADMMALIYLVDAGKQKIPTNVYINNLYVLKENDIWRSSSLRPSSVTPEFILTKIGDENQSIPKDDLVDVIAEVTDTLSRRIHYVIARNQSLSDL
ncbi:MAG TPA: hypothetical protein VK207_02130 [Bacteroidales bacterium]|nr:hypothetical protein [Bacteroidales bacterium]